MAVKRKDFVANTVLKADEVEQVQDNGVIQVDLVADLSTLPDTVKLAFCLADESVYVNKAGSWKKFVGSGANPLGAIMAYGLNQAAPAGWQKCDGGDAKGPLAAVMSKVPNLINRAVVGKGSGHAYNTPDGTSSHSLSIPATTTQHTHSFSDGHAHGIPDHQHFITDNLPTHTHKVYYKNASFKKTSGSSHVYVRMDNGVYLSNSNNTGGTANKHAYTSMTGARNTYSGTAAGTTGKNTAVGGDKNFTLDNYPPNLAFDWIIYNGSDQ